MIAEQTLVAVRRSGGRFRVVAAIGAPRQVGDEEWACPVSLSGLHERLHDVHGASSLQALCLAASVLRRLLTDFIEDGGQLFLEDGAEPFSVAACFGAEL